MVDKNYKNDKLYTQDYVHETYNDERERENR